MVVRPFVIESAWMLYCIMHVAAADFRLPRSLDCLQHVELEEDEL